MKKMETVAVRIEDVLVEGMDELVKSSLYFSRGDIVRAAVRNLLKKELWRREDSP